MRMKTVLVAVALSAVITACTTKTDAPKAADGLAARTEQIGGLEVTVTPTALDRSGATFAIAFDTHTGAPAIDVARSALLRVDDTLWTNASWSGDGPGGHHRAGTLRFDAAGAARGTARLTIRGLDEPLDMTWQLTP